MTLVLGALLGFISVAFGAYTEHGLREVITNQHFRFLMTAVRYNQMAAVVITVIGLALLNGGKLSSIPTLKWSGLLFIIGTILFSCSIYLSVLLKISFLINIAPLGGMIIMMAWLMLILTGFLASKKI